MSMVLRASDEPQATRMDFWRHVIDQALVPMDVRLHDGPDERDEIRVRDVGAVRVTETSTGPGEVVRTRKHIGRAEPELYQVFVLAQGGVVGEQGGRTARLGPGDLGVVDISRPYRCVHQTRRAVSVTFPPTLMPLRRDDMARLAGERIPGDRGASALVSSFVRQLPHCAQDEHGRDAARLGTAVVDLLTVALAAQLDRGSAVPPETHGRALLMRVHAFIEARLGDPDLTPATIAAAHHISLRYLHKLFQERQTTVGGWVRSRRLERCRHDLLDPALRDRPVSAIAARWGLTNPAHFSRAFRAVYGLPPSEYRLLTSATG
jgi:AraC-like DNA-binding protein